MQKEDVPGKPGGKRGRLRLVINAVVWDAAESEGGSKRREKTNEVTRELNGLTVSPIATHGGRRWDHGEMEEDTRANAIVRKRGAAGPGNSTSSGIRGAVMGRSRTGEVGGNTHCVSFVIRRDMDGFIVRKRRREGAVFAVGQRAISLPSAHREGKMRAPLLGTRRGGGRTPRPSSSIFMMETPSDGGGGSPIGVAAFVLSCLRSEVCYPGST